MTKFKGVRSAEAISRKTKIKLHFKKHKARYITGAVIVGVGMTCYLLGKQHGSTINVVKNTSKISNNGISIRPNNTMNTNYVTNVYNMNRPGNAGNIVYCPELDKSWASQRKAERELGISNGQVSKILSGALDKTQDGLTFKKIGDFNSDSPRLEEVKSPK